MAVLDFLGSLPQIKNDPILHNNNLNKVRHYAVSILALIALTIVGCGQSSAVYDGARVNSGDNNISLRVEDFESVEEATKAISRALVQEGFQINRSDESAGFVQTQRRDVSGTMEADTEIRLNFAVQDPNTIEVSGEYYGPASGLSGMSDSEDEWRSISFGAPEGSSEDQAWDAMVETAQRIGEITGFRNRSL